jgi:hypothetical protein
MYQLFRAERPEGNGSITEISLYKKRVVTLREITAVTCSGFKEVDLRTKVSLSSSTIFLNRAFCIVLNVWYFGNVVPQYSISIKTALEFGEPQVNIWSKRQQQLGVKIHISHL